MKGISTGAAIVLAVIIVMVGMGGLFLYTTQSVTPRDETTIETIVEKASVNTFSAYDAKFQTTAIDGSDAQDSEGEIDIDVFVWDESKNADLKKKGYVDCSNAVPASFDGTKTVINVDESAFCEYNTYKVWQDWTAADTETKIDDYLVLQQADMVDADNSSGTKTTHVAAGETYLVTIQDWADPEDTIPIAFLLTSGTETKLDSSELENGNIDVEFRIQYYSDAFGHSKISLGGTCEDDEGNSNDLSTSLAGAIDSSLTTATTVKLNCEVTARVKEDGYALILTNPLATSDTEKPYFVFTPFGENDSAWVKYGGNALTGDVPYSTANVDTNQIIQQGSDGCGATLTTSSSTDAVTGGGENQYEASCLINSAETKQSQSGLFDKNAELLIPVNIQEIKVDYDASASGTDELVTGGGDTAEKLMEIRFYSTRSTTPAFTGNLTG